MMNCSLKYDKDAKNITLSSDTACIWSCVVKSGNITLNPYWGELSGGGETTVTIWTYGTQELFGNVICRFDDGNCQVIKEETVSSSNLNVFFITNRDLYLFGEGTKSRFYVYYGKRQNNWANILSSIEFIYGENNNSILSYSGNSISGTVDVEGYELYDISCGTYNETNGYFEVTITSLSGVSFNDSFIIKAKSFEGEGIGVSDLYQHYTINVYQEIVENRPKVFKITPNVIHLSTMFPKQRVSVISLYDGKDQPYESISDKTSQNINATEQYLLGQNISNKNEVMVLNETTAQNHADLVDITKKSSYIEVDISKNIEAHKTESGTTSHQLYFAMTENKSYSGMLTYYYTHIQIPNNELYFQNINNVYAYVNENGTKSDGTTFNTSNAKTISIYFTKNEEIVKTIKNCYYVKYDMNKLVNFEIYSIPSKWIIERQSLYTDEVQRDNLLSLQLTDNIPSNSYETIQLFNNKAAYASIRIYSDEIFVKDKYAFNFGVEESKDKIENISLDVNSATSINVLSQNSEFKEISWLEETKTIIDGDINRDINNDINGYLTVNALYYKIKNDTNSLSTPIKIDENQNIKKMDSVLYEPIIIGYNFKIKYKVDINKYYITYGILHDKKIGSNIEKELKDTNEYFFEFKDSHYEIEIPQPYIGHDIGWYVSHRGNGIKFNVKRYSINKWEEISEGEIASKGGYNVNGDIRQTQIYIINKVLSENDLQQFSEVKDGDVLLYPKTTIEKTITETIVLQQEKTLNELTIYVALSGTTENIQSDNYVLKIGQITNLGNLIQINNERNNVFIETYDDEIGLAYESYQKNSSFSKTMVDVQLKLESKIKIEPYFKTIEELNGTANHNNAILTLGDSTTPIKNWEIKDGYLNVGGNKIFFDDEYDYNNPSFTFYDNSDSDITYTLTPKNSIFFNKKYVIDDDKIKNFDITYQVLEKVVKINNDYLILDNENYVIYNNKLYQAYEDNDKLMLSLNSVSYDLEYNNGKWYFDDKQKKLNENLLYVIEESGEIFAPQFKAVIKSGSQLEILESVDGDLTKLGIVDVDDYIILSNKKYNLTVSGSSICLDDEKLLTISSTTDNQISYALIDNNLEIMPSFNRAYKYVIINGEEYQLINDKLIYENEIFYPQNFQINDKSIENIYVINKKGYSAMTKNADNYVIVNNNKCLIQNNNFDFYQPSGDTTYQYYKVENVINETFNYSIDFNNLLGEDIIVGKYNNHTLTDGYVQINGSYYIVEKQYSINTNVYPYKVETEYFINISNEYYKIYNNVVEINGEIYYVTQVNNQDAVIYNSNTYFVQNGQILYNGQTINVHERCIKYGAELKDIIKFTHNDNMEKDNNIIYGYISNNEISTITYDEVLKGTNISYKIYLPTYYIETKNIGDNLTVIGGNLIVSGYTITIITNINNSELSYNKANIDYYSYQCKKNGTIESTTKKIIIENGNFEIIINEYRVATYYSIHKQQNILLIDDNGEMNVQNETLVVKNKKEMSDEVLSLNNMFWYTNKDNNYIIKPTENENYNISLWDWYANKMLPMVKIYDNVTKIRGEIKGNITLSNVEYEVETNNYVKIDNEIHSLKKICSLKTIFLSQNLNEIIQIPYYGSGDIQIDLNEIDENAKYICFPLGPIQNQPITTFSSFILTKNDPIILPEKLLKGIMVDNYIKLKFYGQPIKDIDFTVYYLSILSNEIEYNAENNTITTQKDIEYIIDDEDLYISLDMYASPTFLLKYLPSYQTYGNANVFSIQKINDTDYEQFNIDIKPNNNTDIHGQYIIDFQQENLQLEEYFTIYCSENQTIEIKNSNFNTLYYSKNGGTDWSEVNKNNENQIQIEVRNGETIKMRGECISASSITSVGEFCITGKTELKGNIMSLFYPTEFKNEDRLPDNIILKKMFVDCSGITDASKLIIPISTLTTEMFHATFSGCTNMTSSPKFKNFINIPESGCSMMFAECSNMTNFHGTIEGDIKEYGCHYMFYKCNKLNFDNGQKNININENGSGRNCEFMFHSCHNLKYNPFSQIYGSNISCCHAMFYQCRKLQTAPKLLSTTLKTSCYYNMFNDCISLIAAPKLPATTLANSCYYQMFHHCTRLTKTPELPATTLANSCYYGMFKSCTSLTTAPALPSTILADKCYYGMFDGTNVLPNCDKIEFSSESVVKSGGLRGLFMGTKVTDDYLMSILPNTYCLPVSALTSNCYESMFAKCKDLTTAPMFTASTVQEYCCEKMFSGCTNLTTANIVLDAEKLAYGCYRNMFYDCTSLTQAITSFTITETAIDACAGMFTNCKSLSPSTSTTLNLCGETVQHSTYNSMFKNCEKLNIGEITIKYEKSSGNHSFDSMFYGCSSLTADISEIELPKEFNGQSTSATCKNMFCGCISLTTYPNKLEAKELTDSCYESMFKGCKNIYGIPNMPKMTKVGNNTFNSMFQNCVNIEMTNKLEFNDINLESHENVFKNMFNGCRNLQYIDEINGLSFDVNDINKNFEGFVDNIAKCGYFGSIKNEKSILDDILQDKNSSWQRLPKESLKYPLTISAEEKSTVLLQSENEILYRINSLTIPLQLLEIEQNKTIVINKGDKLYVYSTGTIIIDVHKNTGDAINFKLEGNSMSTQLLDTTNRNYCNVLQLKHKPFTITNNCKSTLNTAPELPATTLTSDCYKNIFSGCTSLTKAPELPATTLVQGCYRYMFYGCTSLTTAIELPATTLAPYCYNGMFYGCTSLITAPELLATTLVSNCYYNMFNGCTSLTTAPELPATKLEEGCYGYMFKGCTSLIEAPELLATTLVSNCYYNMFNGCSKLNYIKMLATDISASDCLTNWVNGVASSGTFVRDENMISLPIGESGIPKGWAVYIQGENGVQLVYNSLYFTIEALENNLSVKLSVNKCYYRKNNEDWKELSSNQSTELINSGDTLSFKISEPTIYNKMTDTINGIGTFMPNGNCKVYGNIMSLLYGDDFQGQTVLSGETYNYAFYGLFKNRKTITDVKNLILPATILSDLCYSHMFSGCTSLTTALELPATTLADYCYSNMFDGCTSLTKAPALPAITLSSGCYDEMFKRCTKLEIALELPAETLAGSCYNGMFNGCTNLTTAPELPAETLAISCYSSMFKGCTSLTTAPELLAENLVQSCYSNMFEGCSNLSYIKMLATGSTGSINDCLTTWVRGVAKKGKFVQHLSMKLEIGENGIPEGWDKETYPLDVRDYSKEYFTIEALENDLTVSLTDNDIDYRIDDGSWFKLSANSNTPSINTGQTLSFRGKLTPQISYGIGRFTINKECKLYGNIMSLLYGDDFQGKTDLSGENDDYDSAFWELFLKCTKIKDVKNLILPATTLASRCYFSMFKGCTNLTTSPELPAETLVQSCYNSMFYGCTSLTEAPDLPATELADYCYSNMFYNCTSLTTAPELPATTLASSCYYGMFNGCKSLTTAPELPATTLADGCYSSMFASCTSLTTAPELLATTLSYACYSSMFYGCTSLTEAPDLPAEELAYYCYGGMFASCSELTEAPYLSATELADYCCAEMFMDCTNLTIAPELIAEILVDSCYSSMFYGCSKLNYIKMLATGSTNDTISIIDCLSYWVEGVVPGGTFVKNKDMKYLEIGESGIPEGWTIEEV